MIDRIDQFIAITAAFMARLVLRERYRAAHPEIMRRWRAAMEER